MGVLQWAEVESKLTDIAECEENDFEETTREERFWMKAYRDLATSILVFNGAPTHSINR